MTTHPIATSPPLATTGPVRIVGSGLLGASVGLALATRGVEVQLQDPSPAALAVAEHVGAGRALRPDDPEPALVVVAAPPDVCADQVVACLAALPHAVVTDLASVKGAIARQIAAAGGDLRRYVGSHPMAGREFSGPAHAQADLFVGRPWVLVHGEQADAHAVLTVRNLAVDLGSSVSTMTPADHDAAVALVSHAPQLIASLMAARLVEGAPAALGLAGQGLRDVTRIARSSPELWSIILAANASETGDLLRLVRTDLDAVLVALDAAATGRVGEGLLGLTEAIVLGNQGVERIPGKHGGVARTYDVVTVVVPDQPGELGRLFAEMGAIGVNIEDLQLEHSPGQPVGLAALSVLPGVGERVTSDLTGRGWRVVS